MIRFLLFFLLALNLNCDVLEREDVKAFIEFAVENSDLKEDEIKNYLVQAVPSKKAETARQNQPEVKATWNRYRNRYLTSSRVKNGVKFVKEHFEILDSVEYDFGVSKYYIASIIGCETNYGNYLGTYNPLDTIFTRAFDPKSTYWQKQLIELFILSKKYNLDPKSIKSSWSGALGLGQFIPSSYNAYGVDYDVTANRLRISITGSTTANDQMIVWPEEYLKHNFSAWNGVANIGSADDPKSANRALGFTTNSGSFLCTHAASKNRLS